MEKGPQLHKIGEKDTPECRCQNKEQSGRHVAEECAELTEARRKVEGREMEEEEWCKRPYETEKRRKGTWEWRKRKRKRKRGRAWNFSVVKFTTS